MEWLFAVRHSVAHYSSLPGTATSVATNKPQAALLLLYQLFGPIMLGTES
jgi:hypothetical protein